MAMATVLQNASITTSCGREVHPPVTEEENEIMKIKLEHKRSISMRESQNRSLQAEVESLQSQLSDRLKQIGIQQEAFQLKDNHIKMLKDMVKDLQNRLTACGNKRRVSCDGSVTRLRQQLEEKQQEIEELKKQISGLTSSGAKVTTSVDVSVGTSDRHCTTESNGMSEPDSPTECCSERAIVLMESTSTQTKTHTDELDQVKDAAEKLAHQLQTAQELLELKENALEERDRAITDLRNQLDTQHEVAEQQATLISGMRANMRHQSIELTEVSIQKLQAAISEKDTAMALVELQGGAMMSNRAQVHTLTQERVQLMKELKSKMQEKITLLQKDRESEEDEEDQSILVEELQHCSPDKVCEAIQSLEQSKSRLKGYLDQLLAVVLDSNPNLLEGMPRSQQSARMSPDILRVASLNELLEELKEEEEDMVSLQNYTAMLLQRVVDNSPELLDSIDCQSVHIQTVKQ